MNIHQVIERAEVVQGRLHAEAVRREKTHAEYVDRIRRDPGELGFRFPENSNDLLPGKVLELPKGGLSAALRAHPAPTVKVEVVAWTVGPLDMPADWKSPWNWPKNHLFVTFRYPDGSEAEVPLRNFIPAFAHDPAAVKVIWVRLEDRS